ncbi:CLUMA_CG014741, isoform A [Clunio marinus]|uniref:CLUMA_CG014741, isoform A n=1 Tax=Clunio marinus TaxID=568069 RepID=A0A1J1ILV2_9DIPT|nr:CLUMA_CG014741, isoform A [Clunio marinus]
MQNLTLTAVFLSNSGECFCNVKATSFPSLWTTKTLYNVHKEKYLRLIKARLCCADEKDKVAEDEEERPLTQQHQTAGLSHSLINQKRLTGIHLI